MLHHIAMFRFKKGVAPDDIAAIRKDLLALPKTVDSIRSYQVGRDAGINDGTWDFAVVASFDNEAGYREYSTHPEHVVIVKRISEIATDRASLQSYELA